MCIRRTELHFIISFAADDFWLQSLIKVNNQKLARTRAVNVLEFASLNWTILRKLIHRALFFFLCARLWSLALLFCADLSVFFCAIAGADGEEGSSYFLRSDFFFVFHEKRSTFFMTFMNTTCGHILCCLLRARFGPNQRSHAFVLHPILITMMKRMIFFFGSFSRLCVNDDDVTCLLNSLRWPFTMCL